MAKVLYDSAVVEEFARRLYTRATLVAAVYTLLGAIVVAVAFAFAMPGGSGSSMGATELMIGGGLGGAIGFVIGQERGFSLRLQAQTALCQVEIERNTRSRAASAALAS